jgi:hypothetical protein
MIQGWVGGKKINEAVLVGSYIKGVAGWEKIIQASSLARIENKFGAVY